MNVDGDLQSKPVTGALLFDYLDGLRCWLVSSMMLLEALFQFICVVFTAAFMHSARMFH